MAILVGLEAPIFCLFLGSFAKNKVEGLALSKASGIFLLAPFVGLFVKSEWQYIAGIFPTFWVSKAFLIGYEKTNPIFWIYIIIGLLIHLVYIFIFLRMGFINFSQFFQITTS